MLSLVSYQSSDESGESDTEESVSSRIVASKQDVGSSQLKKDCSNPSSLACAVTSKTKESVKITVPSLKEFEDDEKEEPSAKKVKKTSGSGLLSMLPPPKFSKPAGSQKSFMPYVLTKKQASSSSTSSANGLDSSKSSTKAELLSMPLVKTECNFENKPPIAEKDDSSPVIDFFSLAEPQKSENCFSVPLSKNVLQPHEESFQLLADGHQSNTVLPKKLPISSESHSSSPWGIQHESNTSVDYSDSVPQLGNYAIQPSQEDLPSDISYPCHPAADPSVKESSADEGFLQFLRLQGKRKGQDEINIVDVSVDDQLSDKTKWLTKSLTEEIVHRPSRKKNDMPTQLQKRKHQITYLAFQAKERELELRNQWSQNRLTKRETQAKYGF